MKRLHLSGHWYGHVSDLTESDSCAWSLLKDEDGEALWMLQLWSPRPSDRELDQLRENFLQLFTENDPIDPARARFGMDEGRAWFLQKIPDTPLGGLWPEWDAGVRQNFLYALERLLHQDRHSRLLHPKVIGIQVGRVTLPRVLGQAPMNFDDLLRALPALPISAETQSGAAPWELPPVVSDHAARPIRGRGQELTYLKSLMLGLSRPSPMERIVVLQGEEGLGQRQLGQWAAAAAETEGLWLTELGVQHGEKASSFCSRLLRGLLKGYEADFYAQSPETARVLARRLPTFAFLRSGRQREDDEPMTVDEVQAALKVLAFAREVHPRMIQIWGLERAENELLSVLRELVVGSKVAWFLSVTLSGSGNQARTLLTPLKSDATAAFLQLNRLEDPDLLFTLNDLLGPHQLDGAFCRELVRSSLGNPGLLQSALEIAQMDGTLIWQEGAWRLAPGHSQEFRAHQDMAGELLAGRYQRLGSASASLIRLLALAEHPLDVPTLGNALGLAGDPLEDAIRAAVASRLAIVKDGWVLLDNPRVKELALNGVEPGEVQRSAKRLIKALGEDAAGRSIGVHLHLLAIDGPTALGRILEMLDQAVPAPALAERLVQRAMQLNPSPMEQVKLWEYLSEAWTMATVREHLQPVSEPRSPYAAALETLGRARAVLETDTTLAPEVRNPHLARILRKEAFLHIRLQNLPDALRSAQAAAQCLADRPQDPEQPRLRLALGRIHMLQGYVSKALKAFEEGLQLLTSEGQPESREDHVALLVDMGCAYGHRCQFQRAISTLKSAQRLLEHEQDQRRLAALLLSLSQIYLATGKYEASQGSLRDAMHIARALDDLELQGRCYLHSGIIKSLRQHLTPALNHLDRALDRFSALGDRAAMPMVRAWKARTLAALGEISECDLLMLQSLNAETGTPMDRGDLLYLQGEIAVFRGAWGDATRLFQEAAEVFERAGLNWRAMLARLRGIQAGTRDVRRSGGVIVIERAWGTLESLKTPVEGSGSRWLEMEWFHAHALLLIGTITEDETVAVECLTALGEMSAAARDLSFPGAALEAHVLAAAQLLGRGERLGARTKLQDAAANFQEIWSEVPANSEMAFLGRTDIHHYQETVEGAGLRFTLPERIEPLADWTPTQVNLPLLNF